MSPHAAKIIRAAIRGWPQTIRLCLIIIVVAATNTVCLYYSSSPLLPFFMK